MRIYDEANTTNASFQPFKYNGKELDMMHELNTYDYGARQYYSVVPAWDRIDPLAEKNQNMTPYHFCHDNPVNRIDSDGKDDYYTSNGTYLGTNKAETDYIFIAQDYKQIKEGMYEITMDSRLALPDANLSSEAYSKIFTNSLALNGIDTKELCDNKIQVTIWKLEAGGSYIRNDYTDKAKSGDGVASTDMENKSNGALITAYVYPQGSQERDLFATRSNIYSCLGVHEFYGHFKKAYTHKQDTPDATFKKQKDDPSWNKTTSNFKEYIETIIKENGYGY